MIPNTGTDSACSDKNSQNDKYTFLHSCLLAAFVMSISDILYTIFSPQLKYSLSYHIRFCLKIKAFHLNDAFFTKFPPIFYEIRS